MSTTEGEDHSEPVAIAFLATYGEAEVVQAKLRGYGIAAELDDQIEGGSLVVDGEPGVIVEVPAADTEDAKQILRTDVGT